MIKKQMLASNYNTFALFFRFASKIVNRGKWLNRYSIQLGLQVTRLCCSGCFYTLVLSKSLNLIDLPVYLRRGCGGGANQKPEHYTPSLLRLDK